MTIRLGLRFAIIIAGLTGARLASAQQLLPKPQDDQPRDALPVLITDYLNGSASGFVPIRRLYAAQQNIAFTDVAQLPPVVWDDQPDEFPQIKKVSAELALAPAEASDRRPVALPPIDVSSANGNPAPPDAWGCRPAYPSQINRVSASAPAPLPDVHDDAKPVVAPPVVAPPTSSEQTCPATALPCATGGGFYAGAEVTILRPFAGDFSQLELAVPQLNVDLLAEQPNDEFGVAPRVWIGYASPSNVGARVRYWQLDQHLTAETSDTALDGSLPLGSHLARSGRLNMYTVDTEVTQHFERELVTVDVGVGIRAGGLARDRSITFDIPGQIDSTLVFNRNFDGFGPTMVAEVRRQLGDSPFTFLVSPRGTMLFGRVRTEVDIDHDIVLGGSTTPAVSIFTRRDAELYTAELRMGLEWSRELRGGRSVFAHVLWENQFWAGSGVGLSGVGLTGCTIGAGTSY